jgi:hypothetical protein
MAVESKANRFRHKRWDLQYTIQRCGFHTRDTCLKTGVDMGRFIEGDVVYIMDDDDEWFRYGMKAVFIKYDNSSTCEVKVRLGEGYLYYTIRERHLGTLKDFRAAKIKKCIDGEAF